MVEVEFMNDNVVIDPKTVLASAAELDYDQVAVIGMKNGKFEIFSSHMAEEMVDMIDDALDSLYTGEIGFDDGE